LSDKAPKLTKWPICVLNEPIFPIFTPSRPFDGPNYAMRASLPPSKRPSCSHRASPAPLADNAPPGSRLQADIPDRICPLAVSTGLFSP